MRKPTPTLSLTGEDRGPVYGLPNHFGPEACAKQTSESYYTHLFLNRPIWRLSASILNLISGVADMVIKFFPVGNFEGRAAHFSSNYFWNKSTQVHPRGQKTLLYRSGENMYTRIFKANMDVL